MKHHCPFREYIQKELVICRYKKPCDYKDGDKFLWTCSRQYDSAENTPSTPFFCGSASLEDVVRLNL